MGVIERPFNAQVQLAYRKEKCVDCPDTEQEYCPCVQESNRMATGTPIFCIVT